MAGLYRLMGYRALYQGGGDAARENEAAKWFKKSLAALDQQLQLLNAPMNVAANALQIPKINLLRAEMQMMLKDYTNAIVTLGALVRQDPEKPIPLLNLAICELQVNRLDAAKKDYLTLEKMVPAAVAHGLFRPGSSRPEAERQDGGNPLRKALPRLRPPEHGGIYQRNPATPQIGGLAEPGADAGHPRHHPVDHWRRPGKHRRHRSGPAIASGHGDATSWPAPPPARKVPWNPPSSPARKFFPSSLPWCAPSIRSTISWPCFG